MTHESAEGTQDNSGLYKTSKCHVKVGKDETAAVRPSKIQHIEGNLFQCVNEYNLSTLMKDLKMEHKQQCVMLLSGCTIDSYVKEKP